MKAVYTKPILVKREPLSRITAANGAASPFNGNSN
jgi:hypothetical protein